MKYRTLGKDGPKVSCLGLGAMAMTSTYGPVDEAEAIRTIQAGLDHGMNLINTSDAYDRGGNEELIGRAIAGRREQAFIATKFGNLGGAGANGKPDYVLEACDRSLKRLGVDFIDVYLQHRVDPDTPIEDTIGAMSRLVERGKVGRLGLSEAGPETIRRAHAVHPISVLETEYSLWCRFVEDEILPVTRSLGISFMAYCPLGRGMLTGTIRGDQDLAPDDRRRAHPRFQNGNLAHNVAVVRPLWEMAEKKGCTPSQLALAWLLAQGEDVLPIPGTKRTSHLLENLAAADIALSEVEAAALAESVQADQVVGTRYPEAMMSRLGI